MWRRRVVHWPETAFAEMTRDAVVENLGRATPSPTKRLGGGLIRSLTRPIKGNALAPRRFNVTGNDGLLGAIRRLRDMVPLLVEMRENIE